MEGPIRDDSRYESNNRIGDNHTRELTTRQDVASERYSLDLGDAREYTFVESFIMTCDEYSVLRRFCKFFYECLGENITFGSRDDDPCRSTYATLDVAYREIERLHRYDRPCSSAIRSIVHTPRRTHRIIRKAVDMVLCETTLGRTP